MDLVDEEIHRALLYVDMASRNGVGPTPDELNAFASQPALAISRRGGLAAALLAGGLGKSMEQLAGTVTIEPFAEYLTRVGWVALQEGRLETTALGSAVRRALDAANSAPADEVLQTVLDPSDDYAYARVVDRIGRESDTMVVDPFLKLDGLIDLRALPGVRRILTSDQREKALATIGTFRSLRPREDLELRYLAQAEMHDRYVIPRKGPVLQLSTSLNSVGRRIGVLVTLDVPTSDAVRLHHEDLWAKATVVERETTTAD